MDIHTLQNRVREWVIATLPALYATKVIWEQQNAPCLSAPYVSLLLTANANNSSNYVHPYTVTKTILDEDEEEVEYEAIVIAGDRGATLSLSIFANNSQEVGRGVVNKNATPSVSELRLSKGISIQSMEGPMNTSSEFEKKWENRCTIDFKLQFADHFEDIETYIDEVEIDTTYRDSANRLIIENQLIITEE